MGSRIFSITRRLALMFGAVVFGRAATASSTPTTVLFVCEGGTVKSPIAREHLRRLAKARGLAVNAQSRGIAPEDHMTPQLAAALKADRIGIMGDPVLALTATDLMTAEIIVVFNPLPARFGNWQVRDWTDTPSMNEDYRAARAILVTRLEALLDELK